jgi:uncharacterized protein YbcI
MEVVTIIMPSNQTELETAITNALTQHQRKVIGRGPLETCTYIVDDMVIVRYKGVLTVEETHLAKTPKGQEMVKQMRQVLRETFSNEAEEIVAGITGCKIISSHSDISANTGEHLEVFILNKKIQKKC